MRRVSQIANLVPGAAQAFRLRLWRYHRSGTGPLESGRQKDLTAFVVFSAIVLLAKARTVNTPYYWDEIQWARFAYWLSDTNLLRFIPGLHPPDTFRSHPPALYLSLAVLFKLFGQSIWLSHLVILCFSLVGVYFTYLLGAFLYGRKTGFFSALFLFFSPIYFAQSGMFLADLPVTAMGVATIYHALRRRYIPYLVCSIYLVMIKETANAIVLSFILYLFLAERNKIKDGLKQALKYGVPLLASTSFFILEKVLGGTFSYIYSPEIRVFELRNELAFQKLLLISKWLFSYQYRYIFTILLALNLVVNKAARYRKELLLFLLLVASSGYSFALILYLPRYLIPVLPCFYIVGTWSLMELIKAGRLQTIIGMFIIGLQMSSLSYTVSVGNYEWDMRYLKVVRIQKAMASYIEREYPDARVLTIWPQTEQLRRPILGYVKQPLSVLAFEREIRDGYFDLLLVSVPASEDEKVLRAYAQSKGLRLIKRLDAGKIVSELYARE
jgi:hypothetical protein